MVMFHKCACEDQLHGLLFVQGLLLQLKPAQEILKAEFLKLL